MIKELKEEGWTTETIAYLLGITIEEVEEELENADALV